MKKLQHPLWYLVVGAFIVADSIAFIVTIGIELWLRLCDALQRNKAR